ncbi:hypothetical protein GGR50DRAFT_222421 [Xylaria sp. CBS 124048]|nr:hypothetical protein GGR50DRAFT_222421 [Xylaria sp. CBS 124048]
MHLSLTFFFKIISWICVSLRIRTRIKLDCLGWDDFFVVFFRIAGTLGTVFILILYNYGFGEHLITLDHFQQVQVQQKYYVALLSYTVSTTLMKLCVLLQYLRVFPTGRARMVCWFFIVMSAVWGTAFIIIAAIPCYPVSAFWNRPPNARCWGFGSLVPASISAAYLAHVSSNVLLDLVILAIPIPLYYQTFKMKKQRIGFTIMILLGVSVNAISIWRLHNIVKTRAATFPVFDPTFYGPQSIVLASVEVDLASIVASIPVFWPMLAEGWGAIFVTKEVHVTHHHQRLTGEDQFELRPTTGSSTRVRAGSDGSLKLVIMNTEDDFVAPGRKEFSKNSPYTRTMVYPMGGGVPTSNTQVVSEGQRGFERAYKEHLEMSSSSDRLDKTSSSMEQGRAPVATVPPPPPVAGKGGFNFSLARKPSQRG